MEMKSFNAITKEIFLNYGFKKEKKYYILALKEITFFVWLDSWRGLKSFMYYLSINSLHNEKESFEERIDIRHAETLDHNVNPKGSHQHKLCIEEWSEMQYREILNNLLLRYFEPYKEKGLQYLKEIGYAFSFTEKAQMYLFSEMDVNVKMKAQMLKYYTEDNAYIALKGVILSKTDNLSIKVHITTNNAGLYTDEDGNQEYSFYNNDDVFQIIKIGDEIKFFTTRIRFYNSRYPIIALIDNNKITYLQSYPLLIAGKNKYIEWIEKTFPINKR